MLVPVYFSPEFWEDVRVLDDGHGTVRAYVRERLTQELGTDPESGFYSRRHQLWLKRVDAPARLGFFQVAYHFDPRVGSVDCESLVYVDPANL